MSYRKIEVRGKTYEYTVGRTHTKIKGIGVYPNLEIGETKVVPDYCDCGCGLTYSQIDDREEDRKQTGVVTPHIIRSLIEGKI